MATNKPTSDSAQDKPEVPAQVETKGEGSADKQNTAASAAAATPEGQSQQAVNLTGRAVFAVETTAAGVVVRTAFLTEDQRLLDMPAIFPDMVYALNVIDDLRRQVMQHFSQAAQVGAQVIANQARDQQQKAAASDQGQNQGQDQDPNQDSTTTTIKG
ncbi:MAG TPA: hypothetical protein VIC30_10350 [Orrella sp.]